MNDWVVLQKGHVAQFMVKYYFVQTIIRVISKDMICTQQYLISTIRQHEWLSGVAAGPRGRIYEKVLFCEYKIRENIIETYSSFTH